VEPIHKGKNPKALSLRTVSPSVGRNERVKEVKPILGVNLKIEVAKANPKIRSHMLETAYVLEEMLISVEQGLSSLPDREHLVKQKILNNVQKDRLQKEKEELRKREEQNQRLIQRKQLLRDQLDRAKKDREESAVRAEEERKKQRQQELAKKKRLEENKRDFYKKMAEEGE